MTNISLRIESPEILEKYIPDAIALLKITIEKYSSSKIKLNSIIDVLNSALKLSEERHYSSSNIILISCLESISLKLIEFAYSIQNPNLSNSQIEYTVYKKYGSLYKLVTQIDLQSDIPISYIDAALYYKFSTDPHIKKMTECFYRCIRVDKEKNRILDKIFLMLDNNDIENSDDLNKQNLMDTIHKILSEIQSKIAKCEIKSINELSRIGLNVRLEFLTKRLYEDRNLILHGQFDKIENNWKNYMYLVAVITLFDICKEYEEIIIS